MQYLNSNTVRRHYPGLDILRGIAIIMVLFYHNFSVVPLADFGFLGVDLFFILSGFLITDILLFEKNKENFVRNFYVRRILRIFPVYYLTLFFLIYFYPFFFNTVYDTQYYRHNQYWFYLFFQNWLFIAKPMEKTFLLNHFWSLAIEEQFYLLWPAVILLFRKKQQLLGATLILFVLGFTGRLLLLLLYSSNNYQTLFTFCRFDGILIGCALAVFNFGGYSLNKKIIAGIIIFLFFVNLLFLSVTILTGNPKPYFPYCGFTTFSVLFGVITFCFISKKNNGGKTSVTGNFFRFFGKISYSLYVYHWPVFVLLFPTIRDLLTKTTKLPALAGHLLAAGIVTGLAILLSTLSYRYFESFFNSLKNKFR